MVGFGVIQSGESWGGHIKPLLSFPTLPILTRHERPRTNTKVSQNHRRGAQSPLDGGFLLGEESIA